MSVQSPSPAPPFVRFFARTGDERTILDRRRVQMSPPQSPVSKGKSRMRGALSHRRTVSSGKWEEQRGREATEEDSNSNNNVDNTAARQSRRFDMLAPLPIPARRTLDQHFAAWLEDAVTEQGEPLRLQELQSLYFALDYESRQSLIARDHEDASSVQLSELVVEALRAHPGLVPDASTGIVEMGSLQMQTMEGGNTLVVSAGSWESLWEKLFDCYYDMNDPEFLPMFVTVVVPSMGAWDRFGSALLVRLRELQQMEGLKAKLLRFRLHYIAKMAFGITRRWSPSQEETFQQLVDLIDPNEDSELLKEMKLRQPRSVAGNGNNDPEGEKPLASFPFSQFPPEKWAEAFHYVAWGAFVNVTPDDLCAGAWKTSPTVLYLTKVFVGWQSWACAQVVMPLEAEERLTALRGLIHVAHILSTQLYCFHAAFAVYAGLNMLPVGHLKSAWAKLSRESLAQWGELEALFSPSRNHANYHAALHHAYRVSKVPVVPYTGIWLKYLFTIEDANATMVEGLCSVAKFRMIFQVLLKLLQAQQWDTTGLGDELRAPDETLRRHVESIPLLDPVDEDYLYQVAVDRERDILFLKRVGNTLVRSNRRDSGPATLEIKHDRPPTSPPMSPTSLRRRSADAESVSVGETVEAEARRQAIVGEGDSILKRLSRKQSSGNPDDGGAVLVGGGGVTWMDETALQLRSRTNQVLSKIKGKGNKTAAAAASHDSEGSPATSRTSEPPSADMSDASDDSDARVPRASSSSKMASLRGAQSKMTDESPPHSRNSSLRGAQTRLLASDSPFPGIPVKEVPFPGIRVRVVPPIITHSDGDEIRQEAPLEPPPLPLKPAHVETWSEAVFEVSPPPKLEPKKPRSKTLTEESMVPPQKPPKPMDGRGEGESSTEPFIIPPKPKRSPPGSARREEGTVEKPLVPPKPAVVSVVVGSSSGSMKQQDDEGAVEKPLVPPKPGLERVSERRVFDDRSSNEKDSVELISTARLVEPLIVPPKPSMERRIGRLALPGSTMHEEEETIDKPAVPPKPERRESPRLDDGEADKPAIPPKPPKTPKSARRKSAHIIVTGRK